jgi:hypothetical protein
MIHVKYCITVGPNPVGGNPLLRNKNKYYSFRKSSQAGADSGLKEALSSQVSLVPISFPLDIASIIDGLIYGRAILVFSDASGCDGSFWYFGLFVFAVKHQTVHAADRREIAHINISAL